MLDLARLARATWRNDAGQLDPDVHRAVTPPWLGTDYVAEVDLAGTGHGLAVLAAFAHRAETVLPGGRVLLGSGFLGHVWSAGPLARFTIALPSDPSLCGLEVTTQAGLFGGGMPFELTNAQDLVLGFP